MAEFNAKRSRAKRPCPIWVDAFQRDTQHLAADEVGAYFLIIMAMWTRESCDFPDDDRRLARVSRVSTRLWKSRIGPVLRKLLRVEGNALISPRLKKEATYTERQCTQQHNRRSSEKPPKPPKNNGSPPTADTTADRSADTTAARPTQQPNIRDGVVDAGARASTRTRTREDPDLIIVDEIIYAANVDPAKAINGWLDGPVLASLSNWRGLGIPDDDIINTIRDVASRKRDGPARSPTYFDGAMQKLAAVLAQPPLTPDQLNGGSDGQRDGKDDEFRQIIAAAARGTSGKDWG